MNRTVLILFVGVGVLAIGGLGLLLWPGVQVDPHALLGPAWGMQHPMHSMHDRPGTMHSRDGMIRGWMQGLHQTCMSWFNGSESQAPGKGRTDSGNVGVQKAPSSSPDGESSGSQDDGEVELQTTVRGGFAYRGANGSIRDERNPELVVRVGREVTLKLVNDDGVAHDLVIPALGVRSEVVSRRGEVATLRFTPEEAGSYAYYCSLPGHRVAGMEGRIVVEG